MKRPKVLPLLPFVVLVLVSTCAAKKEVTLHGFVTAVHSPTSFEIDDYKITDNTASASAEKRAKVPHLKPGELRIGLEVEVKGSYYPSAKEVMARAIAALNDDDTIEGMGLVQNTDKLASNGQVWSGTLVADGETLTFAPETVVTVKRSSVERKELRKVSNSVTAITSTDQPFGATQLTPETFVRYHGIRQLDGSILVKSAEFENDYVAEEEQYDWKRMAAHVDYSNSQTGAGTLTVGETQYSLFPCPQAQEYLTKLGTSLIPQYQRELPDKSPGKVLFRFFLIDTDTVAAGSYPNGIVVVSAHMIEDLDNEAELAFVLSHDMVRTAEKQAWRAFHYHRAERLALAAAGGAAAPFTFGGTGLLVPAFAERGIPDLQRELDAQADRVGVEYMLAADYDPHAAPETWRAIARDRRERTNHLFWGHRDFSLLRRSYLQAQLQIRYGDRDFSTLKKDSPEFRAAVEAIKAARQRNNK